MLKILRSISDCTEWGQVCLLKELFQYETSNPKEVENILDRMLSRLSHINPAVVFYASKVIIKFSNKLSDDTLRRGVLRKLSSPLVTLLSGSQSMVYVILKNIQIIVKQCPIVFTDPKVFFVSYKEPLYIKREKLKILVQICTDRQHQTIVSELHEYCHDPSPDFSKLAVHSLWQIAARLDVSLESVYKIFGKILGQDQASSFLGHLLAELCIGLQMLHRKYKSHDKTRELAKHMSKHWAQMGDETSKAAFLYLMQKFPPTAEGELKDLVEGVLEDFKEEEPAVQMAGMGLVMKSYLDKPKEFKGIMQKVLKMATEGSENPDLRDRAFVFWKLIGKKSIWAYMFLNICRYL